MQWKKWLLAWAGYRSVSIFYDEKGKFLEEELAGTYICEHTGVGYRHRQTLLISKSPDAYDVYNVTLSTLVGRVTDQQVLYRHEQYWKAIFNGHTRELTGVRFPRMYLFIPDDELLIEGNSFFKKHHQLPATEAIVHSTL